MGLPNLDGFRYLGNGFSNTMRMKVHWLRRIECCLGADITSSAPITWMPQHCWRLVAERPALLGAVGAGHKPDLRRVHELQVHRKPRWGFQKNPTAPASSRSSWNLAPSVAASFCPKSQSSKAVSFLIRRHIPAQPRAQSAILKRHELVQAPCRHQ